MGKDKKTKQQETKPLIKKKRNSLKKDFEGFRRHLAYGDQGVQYPHDWQE